MKGAVTSPVALLALVFSLVWPIRAVFADAVSPATSTSSTATRLTRSAIAALSGDRASCSVPAAQILRDHDLLENIERPRSSVRLCASSYVTAAERQRVAFFGFFLINSSLEPTRPAEEERLHMLDALLLEKLAQSGRFGFVAVPADVRKQAVAGHGIPGCNGCERDLAELAQLAQIQPSTTGKSML
jgi:Protein of unknown function (DUF2380)